MKGNACMTVKQEIWCMQVPEKEKCAEPRENEATTAHIENVQKPKKKKKTKRIQSPNVI